MRHRLIAGLLQASVLMGDPIHACAGTPAPAETATETGAEAPLQEPAALSVGDMAPALEGVWLKGGPRKLEKGKIYVLDFWATWCGACMMSFPKYSYVARAHKGDAEFLGVNVWENQDVTREKLTEFVRNQKQNMDVDVVADVQDGDPKKREGPISRAWLRSAKINSIPTMMIVDREGRIAWIGNVQGLDAAIEGVKGGSWNLDAARADYEQRASELRARLNKATDQNRRYAEVLELSKTDPAAALKAHDELVAAEPYKQFWMDEYRMAILMRLDEEEGVAFAKRVMQTHARSPGTLEAVSEWISAIDGLKGPAYALALEWSELAIKVRAESPLVSEERDPRVQSLMTHAAALARNGRAAEAVEEQKRGIELMKGQAGFSPSQEVRAKEALEKYEGLVGK